MTCQHLQQRKVRRVKQCNTQKITETTPLLACLRQTLLSFALLWRSPVQCKSRLPLDYKLIGSERPRVNRDCVFLPSPSPAHSGDFRAGLSVARVKGRRKASSKQPAGLHCCHPTPFRLEAQQRMKKKNRHSVKLTYGAWQQSENLGISRVGCDFNILFDKLDKTTCSKTFPSLWQKVAAAPAFPHGSFALCWDEATGMKSGGLGSLVGFFGLQYTQHMTV